MNLRIERLPRLDQLAVAVIAAAIRSATSPG
jgi:hypothetical protein